jgi:2-methylcitrate dehydratase PrpD
LKLSVASVDNALGLAATQATGLRAQFGSSAKPFHAGVTARIGYESAQLAYRGFQGQPGVLAAFIDTLGLGAGVPERLNEGWGAPWRIVDPGLEFKRYPTCGGTHGAADAALGLRTALFEALDFDPARALTSPGDLADIFAARIESAVLSFPPGADVAPYVRVPVSQVEARFSLEYVIATALFDGEVTLDRFADGPVDTRIAAFAARVERRPDLAAPPDAENPDARFHELRLTLKGGQILTRRVTRDEAQKTPSDVAAKLAFSLDLLKSKVNADRVLTSTALTKNEDIGALLDLLDPPIHDAG